MGNLYLIDYWGAIQVFKLNLLKYYRTIIGDKVTSFSLIFISILEMTNPVNEVSTESLTSKL